MRKVLSHTAAIVINRIEENPQYSHGSAVFWDEVFTNLNVPLKVKLIILPDN
jgi:hypothetical protein